MADQSGMTFLRTLQATIKEGRLVYSFVDQVFYHMFFTKCQINTATQPLVSNFVTTRRTFKHKWEIVFNYAMKLFNKRKVWHGICGFSSFKFKSLVAIPSVCKLWLFHDVVFPISAVSINKVAELFKKEEMSSSPMLLHYLVLNNNIINQSHLHWSYGSWIHHTNLLTFVLSLTTFYPYQWPVKSLACFYHFSCAMKTIILLSLQLVFCQLWNKIIKFSTS